MATFVLVHGAWHGGWCWIKVAEPLRTQGHRVFAPTLTGLGERAHLVSPDINLDTHIQDIVGVLESEELMDVILVGHSYAGMVITGVAERVTDRLSALVYVDAFVPENGQSMLSINPERVISGPGGGGRRQSDPNHEGRKLGCEIGCRYCLARPTPDAPAGGYLYSAGILHGLIPTHRKSDLYLGERK